MARKPALSKAGVKVRIECNTHLSSNMAQALREAAANTTITSLK